MLSDVLIEGVEEFEDADEDEEDEDRKCWNTSFSVTGKYGSYCGCGGPYAITEDKANSLQVKVLTAKDGLGDIESLEVEDWSVPPFAKSREA